MFHEMIFKEECPPDVEALLVASGSNVIAALKFTEARDMALRARALDYVMEKLQSGHGVDWFEPGLTMKEQALHILVKADVNGACKCKKKHVYSHTFTPSHTCNQGVFYHTACVQLSEAMSHLIICIAQHPRVDERLQHDDASGRHVLYFYFSWCS